MEFFKKVKALCATEFMTYATCLERGSANMEFTHCRNTQVRNQFSVSESCYTFVCFQAAFDNCMMENYGMERPHYGYHSLPKVI